MGKRWFLVGVMLLLASLLVVGCGVPEEEHEAVVAERDAAQAQVSELASSLEEAEAELGATQAELEAAQAKVSDLESSLGKSQNELVAIKAENQDLEQANAQLKRLTLFVTALSSEEPEPEKVKPKPGNTFKTNETVYVYGRVTGFKHSLVDQELQVRIDVSIKIVNAEGKVVDSDSWTDSERLESPWAFYWFYSSFQRLEAGDYTAEVAFTDQLSGETATWEEEFQVVPR